KLGMDALSFSLTLEPSAIVSMLKWNILSIDYTLMTVLGGLALLSTSMVYMAGRHLEEDIRDIGIFPAVVYVFWFFIVVGFMSLAAVLVVARNYVTGGDLTW
ncbi:MAG: hypothetical protein ABEJ66_01945, partial [Candidatus Nanohaloarchaea archaeon]